MSERCWLEHFVVKLDDSQNGRNSMGKYSTMPFSVFWSCILEVVDLEFMKRVGAALDRSREMTPGNMTFSIESVIKLGSMAIRKTEIYC